MARRVSALYRPAAECGDGSGKADLATARLYSSLVEDEALRKRVFEMIEAEFHRTVHAVLAVTQQTELLETNPVLARSIKLRTPTSTPCTLSRSTCCGASERGRTPQK